MTLKSALTNIAIAAAALVVSTPAHAATIGTLSRFDPVSLWLILPGVGFVLFRGAASRSAKDDHKHESK